MAERQHAECAYNVGAFPGRVLSYVHAAAGRRARCRRAHVRNACTAARTTNNKAGSGRLALQAAVHGVVRQACSEAAWAATWQTAALCKAVQGPRGRPSPGARGARLADGGERGADASGRSRCDSQANCSANMAGSPRLPKSRKCCTAAGRLQPAASASHVFRCCCSRPRSSWPSVGASPSATIACAARALGWGRGRGMGAQHHGLMGWSESDVAPRPCGADTYAA
jgi:hypothetical protein